MSPSQTKYVNALMLTCGTYDAVGDFAYRVGFPAKSGVGGGIIERLRHARASKPLQILLHLFLQSDRHLTFEPSE